MNRQRKLQLFGELVRQGFQEIEMGVCGRFTDFELIRQLIDEGGIPDGVTPMVVIQLRGDLIGRDGAHRGWPAAGGRLPVRHGERSCNRGLITLAFNLYTQGVGRSAYGFLRHRRRTALYATPALNTLHDHLCDDQHCFCVDMVGAVH